MGTIAARKAAQVVLHAQQAVGIELICAAQALEFHRPAQPGAGTRRAYESVRDGVPRLENDRVLADDLARGAELVISGRLIARVEDSIGRLA